MSALLNPDVAHMVALTREYDGAPSTTYKVFPTRRRAEREARYLRDYYAGATVTVSLVPAIDQT